jgi:hypothetical protein
MSKDIWGDEPFRDGQPELINGQWKEPDTYTPAPENVLRPRAPQPQPKQEEYNLEELTEEVANEDEDDEDDFTEALSDARLRLEQGKLYEMVMNHDLFGGVEADPRAAKSVQKQIRKFAKEQMEIMLGMRQVASAVEAIVSSPFNDLEVQILKKLASAASKGATESEEANQPQEPIPVQQPRKKTLNTISSSPRHQLPAKPMAKKAEPIKRPTRPKMSDRYPAELEMDYKPLDKPIHEMTQSELAERDREAQERQKNKMVITPKEQRQHWPSYEEQTAIAQAQVSRAVGTPSKGNLSALIMANLKGSGKL